MTYSENETMNGSDWLLLSGESDSTLLAEALTYEHYPFIYQLALFLTADAAAADLASGQVLVEILSNTRRYSGKTSVRIWLTRCLLKYLQEIDTGQPPLPKADRLSGAEFEDLVNQLDLQLNSIEDISTRAVFLLVRIYDWPTVDIAQVTGWTEKQVQDCLQEALKIIYPSKSHDGEELSNSPFMEKSQVSILIDRIRNSDRFEHGTSFSSEHLDRKATQLTQRAHTLIVQQNRMNNFKEILLIGIAILSAVWFFRSMSQWLPSPQDNEPMISLNFPSLVTPTPLWKQNVAYVVDYGDTLESISRKSGNSIEMIQNLNDISDQSPIYPGKPLWIRIPIFEQPLSYTVHESPRTNPRPISTKSSPEAIHALLRNSRSTWTTLWADYQISQYYMGSRSENMNAYRYQVWITQPYRSNELIGDFSGDLDFRHIILFGRAYNSARYSISYLDHHWVNLPKTVVYSPLMRAFFFPDSLELLNPGYGQVKVLGKYIVAGRPALKISWRAPDNSQLKFYWIDTHTGIVLRRLEYDIFDRLKNDIMATQIVYDAPIPDPVFDPRLTWAGGFAGDPNGPTIPYDPSAPAPTPAFSSFR